MLIKLPPKELASHPKTCIYVHMYTTKYIYVFNETHVTAPR